MLYYRQKRVVDSFATRWKWLIALPSDMKMADCFTIRWNWLTALLSDESSRLLHHQIKVVVALLSDESGDCFIIRWKWRLLYHQMRVVAALSSDESGCRWKVVECFTTRWKWLNLYYQMKVVKIALVPNKSSWLHYHQAKVIVRNLWLFSQMKSKCLKGGRLSSPAVAWSSECVTPSSPEGNWETARRRAKNESSSSTSEHPASECLFLWSIKSGRQNFDPNYLLHCVWDDDCVGSLDVHVYTVCSSYRQC